MTYVIPPPVPDDKPRMVRVTDAETIEAMKACSLRAPIGFCDNGLWWAEVESLRQWREE